MQDRQTHCDECHKDFRIKLKTKTHNFTIKEAYFVCPHCLKKYIAFITDPECRKLQKEINQLQLSKNISAKQFTDKLIPESEYIKSIDDIELQIESIQKELEPLMQSLKWTYA